MSLKLAVTCRSCPVKGALDAGKRTPRSTTDVHQTTDIQKITNKMLIIGLTGSIATGKSTVSSLLSSPPYNLPIVDADLLARKVVEPGTPGYRAIVSHFGPSTPDLLVPPGPDMPEAGPTGKGRPLNRPALGRRVFGDDPERKKDRAVLNGIVHPAVRREMFWGIVRAYLKGYRAVVLDVPLLFESRLDRFCGTVMVVAVRDPEVQMRRLRARDPHLSAEDAENRVRSQGDVRDKARRCEARGPGRGIVVWNDDGKEELVGELRRAMDAVEKASPRWWGWVLWACPPAAVAVAAWEYWKNGRVNRAWEEQVQKDRAKL
ncbi:dephospho-CoA kinase [Echria macrotheca]|uniref:Dephospho-CoA kinase n=1 Tax=Echria macrotheca TaxID=438768 RepID=A0AAJ0B318_9PEZI|nr:dephospho-CoA kinase [Echria macrotheca]